MSVEDLLKSLSKKKLRFTVTSELGRNGVSTSHKAFETTIFNNQFLCPCCEVPINNFTIVRRKDKRFPTGFKCAIVFSCENTTCVKYNQEISSAAVRPTFEYEKKMLGEQEKKEKGRKSKKKVKKKLKKIIRPPLLEAAD